MSKIANDQFLNRPKSRCIEDLGNIVDSWFSRWNSKILNDTYGLEDAKEELKQELVKWVRR